MNRGTDPTRRLSGWLRANAIFSAVSGAIMALAYPALPELIGVGGRVLYLLLGIGLVLYAVWLWILSRGRVTHADGLAVVAGDVLWVVGTVALMASGALTTVGLWIVGAVAVVIGIFAVGQGRSIVQSTRHAEMAVAALLVAGAALPGGRGALAGQAPPALPSMEDLRVLPDGSTDSVDGMLEDVEAAYAAMDVAGFVSFFSDDFEQVDVNRRVVVRGKEAWRRQTVRINGLHESMGRLHHGRALIGDWLVVELEWFGTLRGDRLDPAAPENVSYRYSGLGLLQIEGGRVRRQILYGDIVTLEEQLAPRLAGARHGRPSGPR